YTHRDNDRNYSKFSFGASTQFNGDNFYRVMRHTDSVGDFVFDSMYHKNRYTMYNTRYTFGYVRNSKLSARSSLRYGLLAEMYMPFFKDSNLLEKTQDPDIHKDQWVTRLNTVNPFYLLVQPYVQWKFAVSEKVTTNLGLHGQYFSMNNSWSIEPRFSIK